MRMRTSRSTLARFGLGLAGSLALLLAGCGDAGSSGTAPAPVPSGAKANDTVQCAPVAGKDLVVLDDDKGLQTADNIVPAISAKAATPPLVQALDKVSAALSQGRADSTSTARPTSTRKPPATAAKDFVAAKGLAGGVTGGSGKVVVGAANFSENQTLANVYAEVLRSAGFDTSVKTVGNRELYAPALLKGELQVVPEYVGTLTEFLNKRVNGPSAKPVASGDATATAAELAKLGEKAGLKFGKPAEAADQTPSPRRRPSPTSTWSRHCPTWRRSAAAVSSWADRPSARSGRSASRGWSRSTASRSLTSPPSMRAGRW
jgi:osmoprotectant transport system substrate-binding protein